MTRAVVDTNVLASGVARRHPESSVVQLVDRWIAGGFDLVLSDPIATELTRTLQQPYFRRYVAAAQADRFVALLGRRARITPITVQVQGVATHPEDDLILATAVSAKADYLVTGDKKLQELGSYEEVRIVSPAAFLEILTTSQEGEEAPNEPG